MQVVVTGAGGFLGKHLVSALAVAGHGGVAVSRQSARILPPRWRGAKRPEFLATGPVAAVDWVVHLEVKQHIPQPTVCDLEEFQRVNVEGTAAWLGWCARHDVTRFAYLSTIKAVRPNPAGATDEGAAGPPASPYGASKWNAEQLVRQWAAADARRAVLILRPAVIYGAGCTANVASMRNAIVQNRFFLVGLNDNIKSLVAVENVTAALAFLLERARPGCEIYNLVDDASFSVREIDARLRSRLGKTGNSPSLPRFVAVAAALTGDLCWRLTRRQLPVDSARLAALLETTWFSADKLKRAGFRHPVPPLESL
jgi:nucleoside-diphosphate-sugar epimerase